MRTLLIFLVGLAVATALNLEVEPKVTLENSYQLSCSGAHGQVSYNAQNLPKGVQLNGNRIEIVDRTASNGYYPIKIKAWDQSGNTDERIIVIIIRRVAQTQTGQSTVQVQQSSSSTTSTVVQQVEQKKSDVQVNSLLDSYAVPNGQGGNFVYPENGYPSYNLPTGSNSNTINFTPQTIASEQGKPSDANRNKITSDDVKTAAIFERQLNAARALANLLDIVRQATANRNTAQEEIGKREVLYTEALTKQQLAQQNVNKAENDLTRLKGGIASLTNNIAEIRREINVFMGTSGEKRAERDSIFSSLSANQVKLGTVDNMIEKNQNQLADQTNKAAAKTQECNGLEADLIVTKNDLKTTTEQHEATTAELEEGKKVVSDQESVVEELKKQLAAAEAKLESDRKYVMNLQKQQNDLVNQIGLLNKRISDLQAASTKCFEALSIMQISIDQLKNKVLPELQIQKAKIEAEIKVLSEKLSLVNGAINSDIPAHVADLEARLPKLNSDLSYLRSQLPAFQKYLNDAYHAGNSANEAVLEAKQNLEAAQKRYEDEEKIIQNATRNIELARIEKDQADLEVENLLKEGANILPFAAAPSSSGFELNTDGQMVISSWADFVSQYYGDLVKPYYTGDIKSLYSYKIAGESSASNLQTEAEKCPTEDIKSLSGYVIAVGNASFRLLVDGTVYTIQYSHCTQSLANMDGYIMAPGDIAVVKGRLEGKNMLAANIAFVKQPL